MLKKKVKANTQVLSLYSQIQSYGFCLTIEQ